MLSFCDSVRLTHIEKIRPIRCNRIQNDAFSWMHWSEHTGTFGRLTDVQAAHQALGTLTASLDCSGRQRAAAGLTPQCPPDPLLPSRHRHYPMHDARLRPHFRSKPHERILTVRPIPRTKCNERERFLEQPLIADHDEGCPEPWMLIEVIVAVQHLEHRCLQRLCASDVWGLPKRG